MQKSLQQKFISAGTFLALIVLWLLAFKSSALFSFFETYSSLWYLPAGITLSIAIVVPLRFVLAPLIANWLLAIPLVSSILHVEYTSVADHLLHGTRLFLIYGSAGLYLRYGLKIQFPISNLSDQLKVIAVTLIASLLGAASGVSLHVAMGSFDWGVASEIFLPWMIGDGIAAVIVPPLLVPLLIHLIGSPAKQILPFPTHQMLLLQLAIILVAMFIAFALPSDYPKLGSLWFIIILPPTLFAVCYGIPAATSIAITALLVPPLATVLGYEGERISLQFLILIGAAVSLMIGGAISDRNRVLQQIRRHEEELESQVEDRTKELKKGHEFQKHLLRSVGHDIRQPIFALNNVIAAISMSNKNRKLDPAIEQAVSIGDTASKFVTTVMDYAKCETGKVEASKKEFPIQRIFDQIRPIFDNEVKQHGSTLIIHPTNLLLNTDEHLLWEALANIVQNAVRLSDEDQRIDISAQQDDETISIIVEDQIKPTIDVPGEAGFGLDIIRQISELLEFKFELQPNKAQITFTVRTAATGKFL